MKKLVILLLFISITATAQFKNIGLSYNEVALKESVILTGNLKNGLHYLFVKDDVFTGITYLFKEEVCVGSVVFMKNRGQFIEVLDVIKDRGVYMGDDSYVVKYDGQLFIVKFYISKKDDRFKYFIAIKRYEKEHNSIEQEKIFHF